MWECRGDGPLAAREVPDDQFQGAAGDADTRADQREVDGQWEDDPGLARMTPDADPLGDLGERHEPLVRDEEALRQGRTASGAAHAGHVPGVRHRQFGRGDEGQPALRPAAVLPNDAQQHPGRVVDAGYPRPPPAEFETAGHRRDGTGRIGGPAEQDIGIRRPDRAAHLVGQLRGEQRGPVGDTDEPGTRRASRGQLGTHVDGGAHAGAVAAVTARGAQGEQSGLAQRLHARLGQRALLLGLFDVGRDDRRHEPCHMDESGLGGTLR